MAANYLHGVETVEVERGPRPVRTVKSAVIGLIGTAPIGAVNVSTLTLSEKDAAGFGPQLPGFTIPQALDAIYDHGAGTVIVINVLDPATHKTAVANEAIAFDASTDRVKLAHGAVAALVVKSTDGATTYVAGTDYTIDLRRGQIQFKGSSVDAGDTDITISTLKVDGGASRDHFLMQFQSDILNKEVLRPAIRETTALGAAYLAGLATGVWKSREEISHLWSCNQLFEPKMDAAQREKLVKGWHKAVGRSQDWAEHEV